MAVNPLEVYLLFAVAILTAVLGGYVTWIALTGVDPTPPEAQLIQDYPEPMKSLVRFVAILIGGSTLCSAMIVVLMATK